MSGDRVLAKLQLYRDDAVVRSPECDVRCMLPTFGLQHLHLTFEKTTDKCLVTCLDPVNGAYLNNVRLDVGVEHEMKSSDMLVVNDRKFQIVFPERVRPAALDSPRGVEDSAHTASSTGSMHNSDEDVTNEGPSTFLDCVLGKSWDPQDALHGSPIAQQSDTPKHSQLGELPQNPLTPFAIPASHHLALSAESVLDGQCLAPVQQLALSCNNPVPPPCDAHGHAAPALVQYIPEPVASTEITEPQPQQQMQSAFTNALGLSDVPVHGPDYYPNQAFGVPAAIVPPGLRMETCGVVHLPSVNGLQSGEVYTGESFVSKENNVESLAANPLSQQELATVAASCPLAAEPAITAEISIEMPVTHSLDLHGSECSPSDTPALVVYENSPYSEPPSTEQLPSTATIKLSEAELSESVNAALDEAAAKLPSGAVNTDESASESVDPVAAGNSPDNFAAVNVLPTESGTRVTEFDGTLLPDFAPFTFCEQPDDGITSAIDISGPPVSEDAPTLTQDPEIALLENTIDHPGVFLPELSGKALLMAEHGDAAISPSTVSSAVGSPQSCNEEHLGDREASVNIIHPLANSDQSIDDTLQTLDPQNATCEATPPVGINVASNNDVASSEGEATIDDFRELPTQPSSHDEKEPTNATLGPPSNEVATGADSNGDAIVSDDSVESLTRLAARKDNGGVSADSLSGVACVKPATQNMHLTSPISRPSSKRPVIGTSRTPDVRVAKRTQRERTARPRRATDVIKTAASAQRGQATDVTKTPARVQQSSLRKSVASLDMSPAASRNVKEREAEEKPLIPSAALVLATTTCVDTDPRVVEVMVSHEVPITMLQPVKHAEPEPSVCSADQQESLGNPEKPSADAQLATSHTAIPDAFNQLLDSTAAADDEQCSSESLEIAVNSMDNFAEPQLSDVKKIEKEETDIPASGSACETMVPAVMGKFDEQQLSDVQNIEGEENHIPAPGSTCETIVPDVTEISVPVAVEQTVSSPMAQTPTAVSPTATSQSEKDQGGGSGGEVLMTPTPRSTRAQKAAAEMNEIIKPKVAKSKAKPATKLAKDNVLETVHDTGENQELSQPLPLDGGSKVIESVDRPNTTGANGSIVAGASSPTMAGRKRARDPAVSKTSGSSQSVSKATNVNAQAEVDQEEEPEQPAKRITRRRLAGSSAAAEDAMKSNDEVRDSAAKSAVSATNTRARKTMKENKDDGDKPAILPQKRTRGAVADATAEADNDKAQKRAAARRGKAIAAFHPNEKSEASEKTDVAESGKMTEPAPADPPKRRGRPPRGKPADLSVGAAALTIPEKAPSPELPQSEPEAKSARVQKKIAVVTSKEAEEPTITQKRTEPAATPTPVDEAVGNSQEQTENENDPVADKPASMRRGGRHTAGEASCPAPSVADDSEAVPALHLRGGRTVRRAGAGQTSAHLDAPNADEETVPKTRQSTRGKKIPSVEQAKQEHSIRAAAAEVANAAALENADEGGSEDQNVSGASDANQPPARRTRAHATAPTEPAAEAPLDGDGASDADLPPARRTRRGQPSAEHASDKDVAPNVDSPPARRTRAHATASQLAKAPLDGDAAPDADLPPARRTRRGQPSAEHASDKIVGTKVSSPPARRTRAHATAPQSAKAPLDGDDAPDVDLPPARRTRRGQPMEEHASDKDVAPKVDSPPARRTRAHATAPVHHPTEDASDKDVAPDADSPPARRTRAHTIEPVHHPALGDDASEQAPEADLPPARRTRARAVAPAKLPAEDDLPTARRTRARAAAPAQPSAKVAPTRKSKVAAPAVKDPTVRTRARAARNAAAPAAE
ncbi:hypothetical protein HDU86_006878 [Geranomyces michiganensis]|nr:hypothetical protein HDU86_006878 [Geranomyces michiganensis]